MSILLAMRQREPGAFPDLRRKATKLQGVHKPFGLRWLTIHIGGHHNEAVSYIMSRFAVATAVKGGLTCGGNFT